MATATSSLPQHEQPPVANVRLWAGVLLAPAAWTVAELLGYFLVARACDRDPPSGVAHAGITQDVVAIVLGIIAIVGLVISLCVAVFQNARALSKLEPRKTARRTESAPVEMSGFTPSRAR